MSYLIGFKLMSDLNMTNHKIRHRSISSRCKLRIVKIARKIVFRLVQVEKYCLFKISAKTDSDTMHDFNNTFQSHLFLSLFLILKLLDCNPSESTTTNSVLR